MADTSKASSSASDGVALVETAIALPLLILLLVGGLMLGLGTVELQRLERAASDGALLSEDDGRALVKSVGGEVLCWWQGTGTGGCYEDGLSIPRSQVIARGHTWVWPGGKVTPTVRVTRPTEVSDEME